MSNYDSWAKRHDELMENAISLLQKYANFKSQIMKVEKKPSFIRVFIGKKKIDFYIKEIKSKFVKDVWISKKDNFDEDAYYLVYAEKQKLWYIVSGYDIKMNCEIRESEWAKNLKYIVVPFNIFRIASIFLKTAKSRYDDLLQKKMDEWTKGI